MTALVPVRLRKLPVWSVPPVIFDVFVALALLFGGQHRFGPHSMNWGEFALHVGLVTPLLFRRRAPLTAFAAIAAIAFVQWWTFRASIPDIALLLAFYGVAATSSIRRTLAAAAVLEVGVVLAVLRYSPADRGQLLAFVFLSGLVTAAGVLGLNLRVRRAYLHEVEQRAARLELERDQQAQLAVAAERARVAREMHDIVAHNVSVMVALTDGAALTLSSDPGRATTALAEASRAGRAALTDMRRVLGLLRDSGDDAARAPAPGLADLERLLRTVRHTGFEVRYETSGPVAELPAGMQLSAFRIVQEAVTNTMKHAVGATVIDVRLRVDDDGAEITVRDDGSAGSASDGAGHGIVGMRERVAVHEGQVHVGPLAGGWLVRAWLPLRVAEPTLAAAPA